jgi:hypothetical protein
MSWALTSAEENKKLQSPSLHESTAQRTQNTNFSSSAQICFLKVSFVYKIIRD